ncbi:hypothetical protein [Ureibacillus manganicus]|uniref:Lipoprotein n=1 Tax=Ureibacillus manganicus DSM 26584 TaxID=1384049 RepID=A0A0A3I4P8_9BACL|nr:hypothetical protein [Ureibacillus manganicus]KGR78500.1 hypothetical protein CD29_10655 [Ureibacillus manganicus DSM 26584]
MRNIKLLLVTFFLTSILAGCSDITNALSGIDDQAQKAANALTPEAKKAKSIQLEYKGEGYSIDELFTTILRDTQWEYEKNNHLEFLTVKGSWKEGLFEENNFSGDMKEDLKIDGKITINLEIENGQLITNKTYVQMTLNGKKIIDENGDQALNKLHEAYLMR